MATQVADLPTSPVRWRVHLVLLAVLALAATVLIGFASTSTLVFGALPARVPTWARLVLGAAAGAASVPLVLKLLDRYL